MLESGEIDGLRIDHIDGLFDPKAYLEALRGTSRSPFYLVVEKTSAPTKRCGRIGRSRGRPATNI